MNAVVSDAFVDTGRLRHHYRDWGGEGRPVVLVHGLASTSHIWDLVAPLLAGHARVLAVDQRGHGESEKPDGGYDFGSVVEDLRAFIVALHLRRPVVVGHSWGGGVAVQLAAEYTDEPAGVVLVDGGFSELALRPGMTWEQAEKQLAPPQLTGTTVERFVERVRSRALGAIWDSQIEAAVLANFEVQEDGTIRPRFSRANHMQVVRAMYDQRVSQLYPRIRCPVLLLPAIRGDDPAASEQNERKRSSVARAGAALSRGHTVWLEDSIHDVPLQRPSLVADLISGFLKKLEE